MADGCLRCGVQGRYANETTGVQRTAAPCLMILAKCSSRQAEPRRVRCPRWFSAAAISRKVLLWLHLRPAERHEGFGAYSRKLGQNLLPMSGDRLYGWLDLSEQTLNVEIEHNEQQCPRRS
jgi:hypothetical protein